MNFNLVVIPSDGNITKNNRCFLELDLSSCNIPTNIHCFRWENGSGEIEYVDSTPHDQVDSSTIPEWVNSCVTIVDQAINDEDNPPALTNEELSANVREERKDLLEESDWTQLNDSPLNDTKKSEWATYRQSLRDIPTQSGFPSSITWPTKPS